MFAIYESYIILIKRDPRDPNKMSRGHLSSQKNKLEDLELRCFGCDKLLAKSAVNDLSYEIKCTRCGEINAIFKGVTEQVIITDSDGIILYANDMVETITGYKLAEVLGKTPSLWGGQMSEKFYKNMWKAIKTDKKPVLVTVTNRRKDGTLYKAKLQISPVFGLKKEVKMFVGLESVIGEVL